MADKSYIINYKSKPVFYIDTKKEQKVVKWPLIRRNFIFYERKSGMCRGTDFSHRRENPDVPLLPTDPS